MMKILHIDFDSFFASVEQERNPKFRNKPLGVTATNGRTCIIASSREAKKLGIKTGSRTYEAFKLCPTLLLTPANFTNYWEISKKFIAICNYFSPFVEVFSIDELFMDVTLTEHLFGGVIPLITQLKTRIREEIGEYITVSVGIGPNKMLAKMVSGLKKPDGVFEINTDRLAQVYQIAKLQDVCGIGPRIEKRLNMMGIYTLTKLSRTPLEKLIAEFGNMEGNFLYHVGKGQDASVIHSYTRAPDVKSVGRNYCLPRNEYDKRIVLQNVYELCEEVCIKLRRLKKKARSFGIYLSGTESVHGHILHDYYSDLASDMFKSCLQVLYKESPLSNNYVRQVGVWAGYLQDSMLLASSLFPIDRKWGIVTRAIDEINKKFGDHTIRNGFLLYADKLTTVPNGYMADKYERTKLAESAI